MNDRVVVDASLIFKWLVREEYTDKAFVLARSWESSGTKRVAPYLMLAEVTNALHRRVIKDQLSLESASELLDNLIGMNIELYEIPQLHHRALELASQLQQGAAYDSHYLALAEALDCELWTADERFHRVAGPLAPNIHWLGELVS